METIRYYEQVGLIAPPERTASNYRLYRDGDVDRLRFIKRTRELGFSVEEVRTLLGLAGEPTQDCCQIDALASQHLREVDRKITDLKALREKLAAVISSCAGGIVAECRILEAFAAR